MTRRLAWVVLAVCAWAAPVRAEQALVHVVRPGETLAAIAERYYGDPRRESVLVAENGLTNQGGSAIVVGLRLRVPTVSYHRVEENQTWAAIASEYYGDPQRAFVIVEANGASSGEPPDPGAELVIPYPLRHVVAQRESLRRLAKTYYKSSRRGMTRIRRFNALKTRRLVRGQIVLVPMSDLAFTEDARAALVESAPDDVEGRIREKQARIDNELPALREHVRGGRYADAVQMANRLLGAGDLSARQIVSIQRELAVALVALEREDLAQGAFLTLLEQQPDFELDTVTTSPRVLEAFGAARGRREAAAAAQDADAGAAAAARADAGAEARDGKQEKQETARRKPRE